MGPGIRGVDMSPGGSLVSTKSADPTVSPSRVVSGGGETGQSGLTRGGRSLLVKLPTTPA